LQTHQYLAIGPAAASNGYKEDPMMEESLANQPTLPS
jgi:hypothetical protein